MRTYAQAKREAQFSALISGAVSSIDGKELKGVNGYWYLDGKKVEADEIESVIAKVLVDEDYVKSLMV